jgi:hypothetical protein
VATWVRVRDDTTGAVYDVDERSIRAGMTVLTGYPKLSGPYARPRPTKYPPAESVLPRRAAQADAPQPQQERGDSGDGG